MTDLQLAISALAAIAVLWVVVFNIRERRQTKGLMPKRSETPRIDPEGLSHDDHGSDAFGLDGLEFRPTLEGSDDESNVLPTERCDAISELRWQSPIAAARVRQSLRGWRHVGSKLLAFGWRATEQTTPSPGPLTEEIVGLQVGILLATRSGPLHAMEYSEWQSHLTKLAGELGGQAEIPTMSDVLLRARALDLQCAAVDAQLSLCVKVRGMLSADRIQSAAQAAGLEMRGESRFAMGPLNEQRFAVFPGDGGDNLILLLDVPRTSDPAVAFRQMHETAEVLAGALQGEITDEAGRALGPRDLELITTQIHSRLEQMEALGIIPGSTVAQRLFL